MTAMRGVVGAIVMMMTVELTPRGRAGHRRRGGGGAGRLQQPAQMMVHVKLGVAVGRLVFSFQRRARDLMSRGAGGRHSQDQTGVWQRASTQTACGGAGWLAGWLGVVTSDEHCAQQRREVGERVDRAG